MRLKLANDPTQKKVDYHGIKVDVEWPKGSIRYYADSDIERKMFADYGYIRATEAEDGEELDVYIGDDQASTQVYIIAQLIGPYEIEVQGAEPGAFDEFKVVLGCGSQGAAEALYKLHMPSEQMGEIWNMTLPEFKSLVLPLIGRHAEKGNARVASLVIHAFEKLAGPERVKILKDKYPKFDTVIDAFASNDPSGGQQKYLDWMLRQYIKATDKVPADSPLADRTTFIAIVEAVGKLHRFQKYLGTDKYNPELKALSKDVNTYKTVMALQEAMTLAEDRLTGVLRVQQAEETYGKKFTYPIRELARMDPTGKQDYLHWALKQFKDILDNTDEHLNEAQVKEAILAIAQTYGRYHALVQKAKQLELITEDDIESIDVMNVDEVNEYVDRNEKVLTEGEEEPNVIFENDELIAFGPITSQAQLCAIGNKSWCVARWSSGYFDDDRYMGDSSGNPYFILIHQKSDIDEEENTYTTKGEWLAFIRHGNIEEFNDQKNKTADISDFSEVWNAAGVSDNTANVTIYWVTSQGDSEIYYAAEDEESVRQHASDESFLVGHGYEIWTGTVSREDWERAERRGDYANLTTYEDSRIESVDPETITKYCVGEYQQSDIDQSDAWEAFDSEEEARKWVTDYAEKLKATGWTIWECETTEFEVDNNSKPSDWSVHSSNKLESEEPNEEAMEAWHDVYYAAQRFNGRVEVINWATSIEELQEDLAHSFKGRAGGYDIYKAQIYGEILTQLQFSPNQYSVRSRAFSAKNEPRGELVEQVPLKMVERYYNVLNGKAIRSFEDLSEAKEFYDHKKATELGPDETLQLVKATVPLRDADNHYNVAITYAEAQKREVIEQSLPKGTPEEPGDDTQQVFKMPFDRRPTNGIPERLQNRYNTVSNSGYTEDELAEMPEGTKAVVNAVVYIKENNQHWRQEENAHNLKSNWELSRARSRLRITLPNEEYSEFEQMDLPLHGVQMRDADSSLNLSSLPVGTRIEFLSSARQWIKTHRDVWATPDNTIRIEEDALQRAVSNYAHKIKVDLPQALSQNERQQQQQQQQQHEELTPGQRRLRQIVALPIGSVVQARGGHGQLITLVKKTENGWAREGTEDVIVVNSMLSRMDILEGLPREASVIIRAFRALALKDLVLRRSGYQTYEGEVNGKSVKVRKEEVVAHGSYPANKRQRRESRWAVFIDGAHIGEASTFQDARTLAYDACVQFPDGSTSGCTARIAGSINLIDTEGQKHTTYLDSVRNGDHVRFIDRFVGLSGRSNVEVDSGMLGIVQHVNVGGPSLTVLVRGTTKSDRGKSTTTAQHTLEVPVDAVNVVVSSDDPRIH